MKIKFKKALFKIKIGIFITAIFFILLSLFITIMNNVIHILRRYNIININDCATTEATNYILNKQ